MFTSREAKEGFQGAGGTSYRHAGADMVELSVPLHVHGPSGLHHPRHKRLLSRGEYLL